LHNQLCNKDSNWCEKYKFLCAKNIFNYFIVDFSAQ